MNQSPHKEPTHQQPDDPSPSARSRWWYLLLLIPLVGLLYPPFYAHKDPALGGVPFFIWYQFAWVAGGVITTLTVTKIRG